MRVLQGGMGGVGWCRQLGGIYAKRRFKSSSQQQLLMLQLLSSASTSTSFDAGTAALTNALHKVIAFAWLAICNNFPPLMVI